MKVLHLNTHSSGGSHEYAALLSTALAEQGIESHVLCKNSPPTEPGRHFLDRVVRRSYVSLSTEPWHGTRRLLSPPAREELESIDVVHLHTVADWFDVPHWLEALPRRIGVVISVHDMWHVTGGCFLYRGCNLFSNTCSPCPILKTPLNRILAKDEQRRKLDAYRNRRVQFVANSQWLADLTDRSPILTACRGARVITPGIDTDIFKPQDKSQCRAELGIPQDAFVIAAGAASLTDTNKNIPWLLEQLSRLPRLDNVSVILAGDGKVQVPNRLNVRLIWNLVNRHERARVFGAADVFVSASLMETYGLTLVEAMACRTPVVAFRVGGIPEAAPHGQAGILCPPLNTAALIEAITELRESPQLRENLGDIAHELARVRNATSPFADKFAHLYRQIVSSREAARREQRSLTT
jgi:glycosyltransferase involved in cell wall biosynthesis